VPREIHLCLANHPGGRASLVDIQDWLWAGLEECGIKLSASDRLFRGDVPNIIFENENQGYKEFLDAHRGEINLICFVTEVIVGDKFDDAHRPWDGAQRYRDFLSIADHYSGLITMVPTNVESLGRIAPTTFFEFGFTDLLASPRAPEDWRYDYSFFGPMTPYRRQMLDRLGAFVKIDIPGLAGDGSTVALPADQYIDLISRTAINVVLKQHEAWQLPSLTRLARIGHASVGCAAEQTPIETKQSRLFPKFASVADFVEKFGRADRQRIADEARAVTAEYRATLPHRRELERNLDECPALRRF